MIKELILTVAATLNANGGQNIQEKVYTIPEGVSVIESDINWNAMTLFSKDNEALPKIWYQKGNTWVAWHNFEEDEVNQYNNLDLLFAGNERRKITIKSEETVQVVAHFFNTHIPGESLVARFDPFDDDSFDDPRTGLARPVSGPKYISRREWGADETLREKKFGINLKGFFRSSVPEAKLVAKYLRPKVIATRSPGGKKLSWPIEKNPRIKKFIIHHTGEYIDEKRDPKELMRAIYYFHTITRGWGDIGYNYVIDKQGNIYEGRYGGPNIVGAHTAYHNVDSIGVSLMGNFNTEKPTAKQLKILELTLADHAVRYGVNPMGKSAFLGINSYNISGHRDVARKGHGTACPGKNLYALLPEIRRKVTYYAKAINKQNSPDSRDFLAKSKIAPKFIRKQKIEIIEKSASLVKLVKTKVLQRNKKAVLEVTLRNNTDATWLKGQKLIVENIPEGTRMTPFRSLGRVAPNDTGVFRATILVKTTPNGKYTLSLSPQIPVEEDEADSFPTFTYPLQVSGEAVKITRDFRKKAARLMKQSQASVIRPNSFGTQKIDKASIEKQFGPAVKIKLAFFNKKYAILESEDLLIIYDKGKTIKTVQPKQAIKIIPTGKNKTFRVMAEGRTYYLQQPKFITEGVIRIKNYDRGFGKIAYNQFRHQLNFHGMGGRDFIIVNELPIEQYLWGLAEEPKQEPTQKKHAIYVLARSYAYVYAGSKRKFKTPFYDLEDDPRTSQFYLGYDWEYYHANQKKLVAQTKGRVLTYQNQPVIGPYFTQSSGESSNAWHNQYPWTRSQKLPYDEGLEAKGHGVGLSGNSARALAEKGDSYEAILDFFFEGTAVSRVY